jgi:hypothetical protein
MYFLGNELKNKKYFFINNTQNKLNF